MTRLNNFYLRAKKINRISMLVVGEGSFSRIDNCASEVAYLCYQLIVERFDAGMPDATRSWLRMAFPAGLRDPLTSKPQTVMNKVTIRIDCCSFRRG
jgi:hypothetical protein